MDFRQFVEWYKEMGKLKIFWAKPVKDVRLVSTGDMKWLVEIEWIVGKRKTNPQNELGIFHISKKG